MAEAWSEQERPLPRGEGHKPCAPVNSEGAAQAPGAGVGAGGARAPPGMVGCSGRALLLPLFFPDVSKQEEMKEVEFCSS